MSMLKGSILSTAKLGRDEIFKRRLSTALFTLPMAGALALTAMPANADESHSYYSCDEIDGHIIYGGRSDYKDGLTVFLTPGQMISAWPVDEEPELEEGPSDTLMLEEYDEHDPYAVVKVLFDGYEEKIVLASNHPEYGNRMMKYTGINRNERDEKLGDKEAPGEYVTVSADAYDLAVEIHCESFGHGEGAGALVAGLNFLGLPDIHTNHFDGTGSNGGGGGAAAFAPGVAPMTVRDLGGGLSFTVDVLGMAAAASGRAALQPASGPDRGADGGSSLRVTVSADYLSFDDDQTGADRDGDIWRVALAGSYKVGENSRIGVFGFVEEGNVDSTALAGSLERTSLGFGAFARMMLPGHMEARGEFSYATGDNDISMLGATGDFNSDRIEFHGTLRKAYTHNEFWGDGTGKLSLRYDDRDSYTDSFGTAVSGGSETLVSSGIDIRVGVDVQPENFSDVVSRARPYLKGGFDYDFENEGSFAASSANVFESADVRYNFGGGVDMTLLHGGAASLEAGYFGSDTELEGWTLEGGVTVPVNGIPGMAGFNDKSTLGLTADQNSDQGRSMMLRLKLPFN